MGGDDVGAALAAGGDDVVTEAEVWEALAEIPDPEIPVISGVDLGVVRDVQVDDERVHVEFTPTFLGCPALEVMRDAMATRIAHAPLGLGGDRLAPERGNGKRRRDHEYPAPEPTVLAPAPVGHRGQGAELEQEPQAVVGRVHRQIVLNCSNGCLQPRQ